MRESMTKSCVILDLRGRITFVTAGIIGKKGPSRKITTETDNST